MPGVLAVLIGALVLVLTLLVLVLATPVKLHLAFRSRPHQRLAVRARLLGGLTPALGIYDSEAEKPARKARARKTKQKKGGMSVSRVRRMAAAGPDLLAGLRRPVHVETMALDAEFGLGDPAETGQLFGMLTPLIYAMPQSPAISLAVRPNFNERCLRGAADADIRFIPFGFVPPVLRFAWRAFGPQR
tara:strand:- start:1220 stop:1783 length:564 start_codon:yes stop_codon:yes gene_type:complete